nr:hypothetical protein [Tanacetum cinerariifolium]
MDDSLERIATTASSLDVEQDSGNINKNQSKATLNEPSSIRTGSGSGPRCQETIVETISQTRGKARFISQEVLLKEVNVAATTTTTATIDDITLAKALMEIKIAKPKANKDN